MHPVKDSPRCWRSRQSSKGHHCLNHAKASAHFLWIVGQAGQGGRENSLVGGQGDTVCRTEDVQSSAGGDASPAKKADAERRCGHNVCIDGPGIVVRNVSHYRTSWNSERIGNNEQVDRFDCREANDVSCIAVDLHEVSITANRSLLNTYIE